jgi:hypothetical protein
VWKEKDNTKKRRLGRGDDWEVENIRIGGDLEVENIRRRDRLGRGVDGRLGEERKGEKRMGKE